MAIDSFCIDVICFSNIAIYELEFLICLNRCFIYYYIPFLTTLMFISEQVHIITGGELEATYNCDC